MAESQLTAYFSRAKDISGIKRGSLTAVCFSGFNKHSQAMWIFTCDCGSCFVANKGKFTSGRLKACGRCCRKASKQRGIIELRARVTTGLVRTQEGCMEFPGCKRHGYGAIKWAGRMIGAHKAAYLIAYGEIPDGLQVCHKCDNRACCNPDHLFLGTALDNKQDSISKDRHTRGERVGTAILTASQVDNIRREYDIGLVPQAELGRRYGVTAYNIWRIVHNRTWRHILPQNPE